MTHENNFHSDQIYKEIESASNGDLFLVEVKAHCAILRKL